MKTLWYRFIHFVRTLVLGKPKYYMGVDFGYGIDHSAVTMIAKRKDGGFTVVWTTIDPTIEELRKNVHGKISEREWLKLTQYDWGEKVNDNPDA
jgi:hypothetical protein